MKVPLKEEIRDYLKMHKREFPRQKVADHLGISKSQLDNCLSTAKMSDAMRYEIAKYTGMLEAQAIDYIIPNSDITLELPTPDFNKWEDAALKSKKTVSNWLIDVGNRDSEILLAKHFPYVAPNVAEYNVTDPAIEKKVF